MFKKFNLIVKFGGGLKKPFISYALKRLVRTMVV